MILSHLNRNCLPKLIIICLIWIYGGCLKPSPAKSDELASEAPIDSLNAKMSRHKLTKGLASSIFVEDDPGQNNIVPSDRYFSPFSGRVIRRIMIHCLDIFPPDEIEDSRGLAGRVRSLANAIHVTSRSSMVKDYLLMEEGDLIDPAQLADTERILRETGLFHDAVIIVLPVPIEPNTVDLIVATRDVWSLGLTFTPRSTTNFRVTLHERNTLGYGHEFKNRFDIDSDRVRQVEHIANYTIRNIGGSFIRGDISRADKVERMETALSFSRDLIASQFKQRWALEVSSTRLYAIDDDKTVQDAARFETENVWSSYIVPLGKGRLGDVRFGVAGRVWNRHFRVRPPVDGETNFSFHNRTLVLGSLSASRNMYRKGHLIFDYGRTEDIPSGFLATLTGGCEYGEYHERPYLGAAFKFGFYRPGVGYGLLAADTGGYRQNDRWEDSVVSLLGGYFSDLITWKKYSWRQFALTEFCRGINRREGDQLDLDHEAGLTGFKGADIKGLSRLMLRLESVVFAPWRLIGFRPAFFLFGNSGAVTGQHESLLKAKFYSSLGGGVRFHNSRLIFSAFEIRFTYIPELPGGVEYDPVSLHQAGSLSIGSFSPGQPGPVDYSGVSFW